MIGTTVCPSSKIVVLLLAYATFVFALFSNAAAYHSSAPRSSPYVVIHITTAPRSSPPFFDGDTSGPRSTPYVFIETTATPMVTAPPPFFDDGTTGAECTSTSGNCLYPRFCKNADNFSLPCTSSSPICFCLSQDYLLCSDSSDCLSGDRCVLSTTGDSKFCFSCNLSIEYGFGDYFVDDGAGNCVNGGEETLPPMESPIEDDPLPTSGYTFDNCTKYGSECMYLRSCYSPYRLSLCTEDDDWCVCLSHQNIICSKSSDCLYGDRCATYSIFPYGVCLSCYLNVSAVIPFNVTYIDDGGSNCETFATSTPLPSSSPSVSLMVSALPASPSPTSPSLYPQPGYNFDECSPTSFNCGFPRVCMNEIFDPCTTSDTFCLCISEDNIFCDRSDDCLYGDRCLLLDDSTSYCVSCNFDPSDLAGLTAVDDGGYNCPSNPIGDDFISPSPDVM